MIWVFIKRCVQSLPVFRRSERASISVETALISTVLLLLAMGVFDFGGVYARKMELTNAVRAGMQYSLVRKPIAGDYSAIEGAINTALSSHDRASAATVTVAMFCKCTDDTTSACLSAGGTNLVCSDGNLRSAYLQITLSETFDLLFYYPGIASSLQLRETANVRLN